MEKKYYVIIYEDYDSFDYIEDVDIVEEKEVQTLLKENWDKYQAIYVYRLQEYIEKKRKGLDVSNSFYTK